MLSFFHNFAPPALLFSFGWFHIYWYGLIIVLAMIAGILVAGYFWEKTGLDRQAFDDLAFWEIVGGLAGARIYEWFLEFGYYSTHPSELLKVWHGGLAIHGAIIGAFVTLVFVTRKHHLKIAQVTALVVPGLALGQAIGRWGNYFNQELFGAPTNLPWGIFISPENRPVAYQQFSYFHPTFLYESLACLLLFFALLAVRKYRPQHNLLIIGSYFIGYGLIRFLLEFIKIDYTPEVLGLRWPQIISLAMIVIGSFLLSKSYAQKK